MPSSNCLVRAVSAAVALDESVSGRPRLRSQGLRSNQTNVEEPVPPGSCVNYPWEIPPGSRPRCLLHSCGPAYRTTRCCAIEVELVSICSGSVALPGSLPGWAPASCLSLAPAKVRPEFATVSRFVRVHRPGLRRVRARAAADLLRRPSQQNEYARLRPPSTAN